MRIGSIVCSLQYYLRLQGTIPLPLEVDEADGMICRSSDPAAWVVKSGIQSGEPRTMELANMHSTCESRKGIERGPSAHGCPVEDRPPHNGMIKAKWSEGVLGSSEPLETSSTARLVVDDLAGEGQQGTSHGASPLVQGGAKTADEDGDVARSLRTWRHDSGCSEEALAQQRDQPCPASEPAMMDRSASLSCHEVVELGGQRQPGHSAVNSGGQQQDSSHVKSWRSSCHGSCSGVEVLWLLIRDGMRSELCSIQDGWAYISAPQHRYYLQPFRHRLSPMPT